MQATTRAVRHELRATTTSSRAASSGSGAPTPEWDTCILTNDGFAASWMVGAYHVATSLTTT